jgi:hypothetical protein
LLICTLMTVHKPSFANRLEPVEGGWVKKVQSETITHHP